MIKLYNNYKYDNKYDYVKCFATKEEQKSYFNSLNNETIEDENYIRINNVINVPYNFEYLQEHGINYLSFNNGYRDIYGFIVNKTYVNKNVTKIVYEVDVIQTFLFDFSINKSYVERKVCNMDEITDYDEGIFIGEHIEEYNKIVLNKESQFFTMLNGVKNYELKFDTDGNLTDVTDISTTNSYPVTTLDGIKYPLIFSTDYKNLYDYPTTVGVIRLPFCSIGETKEIKLPRVFKNENIVEGDTASKEKYFTANQVVNVCTSITSKRVESEGIEVSKSKVTDFFPYTYYVLTDGECEPLVMQPQYLPNSFTIKGKFSISHQPTERYYPNSYKGDTTGNVYNITNNNQMLLPTATNNGLSYLNANCNLVARENKNKNVDYIANTVIGIGGLASSYFTGGLTLGMGLSASGSALSGYNAIKSNDARNKDIMTTPNSISSYGTPSTRYAFNTDTVRVIKYTVTSNIKNKINNFCSRYGNKYNNYATIDLKSYKGFIKFNSPDLDTKIDNDYINKIISILERGVYID